MAIAFATLEGADLVLPRLGLPDQLLTVLVFLAVLGFPLALVLAWVFEFGPDGVVRTSAGTPQGDDSSGGPLAGVGTRPVRIVTLAGATALFAAAAWIWIPRPPALRSVDLDSAALVVLPFEVRGSEEVAFLREGMVDLLSTKLDGVGGLRVVDPHATFAAVGDGSAQSLSRHDALRVSASLGAGRALLGSIVWVGGSLQARATVYGPGDRDEVEASVEGPAEELFVLVDELVRGLVGDGLTGNEGQLASLEGLTTTSNEALRLYLAGVQNFRLGEGTDATLGLLTRAVALDTTFALASYWAGHVASYFDTGGQLAHFERAGRHQARLSQRDGMRLTAALAGAQGRHADALRIYTALVERYPDDVDGWLQLAEQLAHTGHYSGRTLAEARPVYERAIALDPALAPAYYHLAQIGGLQGDTIALSVWAASLETVGTDELDIALLNMVRSLIVGDTVALRPAFELARQRESEIPPTTLAASLGELMGATLEYAPAMSRALLREFGARAVTDTARVVTARRLARLEVASGRFAEAEHALAGVEAALGTVLPQDRAWIALHSAATSKERVEQALEDLDATLMGEGTGEAAARHYLLARLALKLGRSGIVRVERDALEHFEPESSGIDRFARDLSLELGALSAQQEGDPEHALSLLLQASYWEHTAGWLGIPEGTFMSGALAERYPILLRAELLRDAGQDSAAAAWYEVAADGLWDRGPALLGLAEIRARQGDDAGAAQLYRRVLHLWADGDSDLEGVLRQVTQRLSDLAS